MENNTEFNVPSFEETVSYPSEISINMEFNIPIPELPEFPEISIPYFISIPSCINFPKMIFGTPEINLDTPKIDLGTPCLENPLDKPCRIIPNLVRISDRDFSNPVYLPPPDLIGDFQKQVRKKMREQ